jgi:hypothetical protein
MTFDRIASRFTNPKPIELEPPAEGDPCPDPKCRGKWVPAYVIGWQMLPNGKTGYGSWRSTHDKIAERCRQSDLRFPYVIHNPLPVCGFVCDTCDRTPGAPKG